MQTDSISLMEAAMPPSAIISERFGRLDLALIRESPTNPRKHFDEKAMIELANSIRTRGVAIPILVRDLPADVSDQLELIDGARRFRAAKAAGCVDIPARIIQCDDQTALELQTIANLQREDVHPLDEALGFRQLIERSGYDVPAICARIGKSESYVYQRLKLTDLIQHGRDLLWAEEISVAIALLIARIPAELQQKIIDAEWPLENARRTQEWLDRNVFLRLDEVPWTMADADLVPEAGSCDACPKRTGYTPALFPEVEDGDTCTDPACFHRKKAAYVELKRAEKPEDVIEVSGEYRYGAKGEMLDRTKYHKLTAAEARQAEGAKQALVVDGEDAGKTIWIKPTGATGGYQKTAEEKEAERQRKLEDKIRAEISDRCLDKMLSQASAQMIPDGALRLLAKRMLDRLSKDGQKRLAKSWDVEPLRVVSQYGGAYVEVEKPLHERIDELDRNSMFVAMIDMACRSGFSGEPDHAVFAAYYPVDEAAVEMRVREEFAVYGKPAMKTADKGEEMPKPAKKVPPPKKKASANKAAKKKPAAKKKTK